MRSKESIFKWLDEKGYQTDYEETHEYKMYYAVDMPQILNDYTSSLLENYEDYMTDRISREPGKVFDRKAVIKEFIKNLND